MKTRDGLLPERVWAEIDLDNLIYNYTTVKNKVGPDKKVMAVVKADAYGHGAVEVARELEKNNADFFGVATYEEAMQLRKNQIKTPILILSSSDPNHAAVYVQNDISIAVSSYEEALEFFAVLSKNGCGQPLKIHIKIDTGMSRLGIYAGDDIANAVSEAEKICRLRGIAVEGMFSHFASADDGDQAEFTKGQIACFLKVCDKIEQKGISIPLKHCAASAGIIMYPESNFDMVRLGISLYGAHPSPECKEKLKLRPVMELRTRILQVKELKKGDTVSYGRTFECRRESKIAVVAIGYADGYFRFHSNKAWMLIHGSRVPVVGNVCMDMCMIDVTSVRDVKKGDVVTVIGRDNGNMIPVDELCKYMPTISHEVFCAVGKRVLRIYIKNNTEVSRINLID